MSHSLLSPARAPLVVFALLAILVVGSLSTLGQNTAQDPPLYRADTLSSIGNEQPIRVLTTPSKAYIKGDEAASFAFHYKCTSTTGNPGTLDSGNLLDRCTLGSGAAGSTSRTVTLRYNLTGGDPAHADSHSFDLTATNALASAYELTFRGSRDFSQDNVVDGQSMRFFVRVPVDPSGSNPGVCPGGTAGAQQTCLDPRDTTGQSEYVVKFDNFTPEFILNDPDDANAFKRADNWWYLFSNQNLSSRLPTLVVSVIDTTTGSPIDPAVTKFYRGSNDNDTTGLWDDTVVGTGHSIIYQYDYSDEGGESFADDTTTAINLLFADEAGHQVDTRGNGELGILVVMDIDGPTMNHETSFLTREPIRANRTGADQGQGGLAALGEQLSVRVFANDTAADLADGTPPDFLKVQARLVNGELQSPPYDLHYNTTLEAYESHNVTVPNTWASGVTRANVTVTDPVGLTVSRVINGSVSVDIDRPVVTPIAPLNATVAEGFQDVATISFRVRAEDPGDTDDWNGANTDDNDGLGIQVDDGVRIHYKVGRDGPVNTVRLAPVAAANTFSGTRTFNPEDEIFYYLSARDLAGNVQTYPADSDPHILVTNETGNDGRFLRLQIDQLGPVIKEARDLTYVGDGPHEFVFLITDSGIGVDKTTPRFHWRPSGGGSYREVVLNEETIPLENATGVIKDTRVFRATIPTQADGSEVQWHVSARDRLENVGSLGTATNPMSSVIDVVPPTVTVNAPATSNVARFNITWEGSDAGSGIKDYTLQFRVGTEWFTVPSRERTTATSYEVCAATDTTYQFRVTARDNAGNEREAPQQADASTQVDAPVSCAQAPEVTITSPGSGATLSGATTVRYTAASTSFPGSLDIRLEAGTGASFQTIASGLENTGTTTWNTAATEQTDVCLRDGSYTVRVSATDANGLTGSATVDSVTLQNGITNCLDRDNDGLPDEWEFANFGGLGATGGEDSDGDGFSNLQEFQAGTDPTNPASRPGGPGSNGSEEDSEWDPLYLLVVVGFIGVLGTFVVGMARRW